MDASNAPVHTGYMRTRSFEPFIAIFAAAKMSEPPMNADPPKACANEKPPSFFWIKVPARGEPVKHVIDMTEKHMPVHTPILVRAEVRLAHAAGNRLWIPVAK